MGTTLLPAGILGVPLSQRIRAALPARLSRGHTGHGAAVRPRLTIVCFIMADNQLSSFPIAQLLVTLGARPGKHKDTYHSPFREDKEASLHIDPDRNIWYDHGAGEGGGNVDLVMRCRGCTAREAAEYILSLPQSQEMQYPVPEIDRAPRSESLASRIIFVVELRRPYLLDYLAQRKIPLRIARWYCKEVIIRSKNSYKTFENIGFPNNVGGYALKSPNGFKSTTKGGITTIDTEGEFTKKITSDTVTVFEGFFDFLSWLASERRMYPTTDVVVLNSVAHAGLAISYLRLHRLIICCLDNDDAGRRALESIRSMNPSGHEFRVVDGSPFYDGYNDVNEWWVAMSGK